MWYMADVVRIGERGRVVLPARLRNRLGLHSGDELLAVVDDAGLRLLPRREAAYSLLGAAGDAGEVSAVAELVAERRRAARDEDVDAQAAGGA